MIQLEGIRYRLLGIIALVAACSAEHIIENASREVEAIDPGLLTNRTHQGTTLGKQFNNPNYPEQPYGGSGNNYGPDGSSRPGSGYLPRPGSSSIPGGSFLPNQGGEI